MSTKSTHEKKPTAMGGLGVALAAPEMLVIARCGDGYGVSIYAGTYSAPPTCRQAVDAAIEWLSGLESNQIGVDDGMSADEFAIAGPHLRAFLQRVGTSIFMRGEVPECVEVPGQGRWIFLPGVTAYPG